jgi:hypothetical protein
MSDKTPALHDQSSCHLPTATELKPPAQKSGRLVVAEYAEALMRISYFTDRLWG